MTLVDRFDRFHISFQVPLISQSIRRVTVYLIKVG